MAELLIPEDLVAVPITEMGRSFKTSGVYLLYSLGEVVYVGQSWNVLMRAGEHISEKRKKFDSVAMVSCIAANRLWLERLYIDKFKPKYNDPDYRDHPPRRRSRKRKA